ncbi:MAG: 30S ribosomal protein S9 [Salinivirgaceae bacterium]|nr:30S ribosomal protein S9 [Salinivirgaceae bacterium]MDD4747038.1 30S ribosomal protein S9 [Salinivirgaceae bacterium]
MEQISTIGRRKAAIARVFVSEGSGNITINGRDIKTYFPTLTLQYIVGQPFSVLGLEGKYDVKANLDGGGIKGQAEALRLGISRALCEIDIENRPKLKTNGFLTRDPRVVERKKYGQPKARKRFQFSKR